MGSIVKNIVINVEVVDKETGRVLFTEHNLFTNLGKKFLRDVFGGVFVVAFSSSVPMYAVELGNPLVAVNPPSYGDTNIQTPISPALNIPLYLASPVDLSASSFEIQLNFQYTNNTLASIDFRELGLFYRPGPSYPAPSATFDNILLARLRTTYNKVTIGVGRTVAITWKILF
jgi:hypothetical protein